MNRRNFTAAALTAPLMSGCIYGQYFDIEWDEEVLLHDGRVIMVHVKRTFERRSRTDKWLAHHRDTEITFEAGIPWGKFSRKFQGYDVQMIESTDGDWYINLAITTVNRPFMVFNPEFPFLIFSRDKTERPALSWADIPDFPRQNIMPVTPSPAGISHFQNSLLTWEKKMTHWKNNPRAAGDNGLVIQRHSNKKVEVK